MKSHQLSVLLTLALATALSAAAQNKGNPNKDQGAWRAESRTAESITGDVSLGDEKVIINFATFPIAQIRPLTDAEALALFNVDADPAGGGNLYRLKIPAARKFANKNTLCGAEETEWLITYASGKTLQLALFSGQKMPVLTVDAVANTTTLCGTFTYSR